MASLSGITSGPARQPRRPLPEFDFGRRPSELQAGFFDYVFNGEGNAVLKAVAGSGKSTSLVWALAYIPESAFVTILAFSAKIAPELKEKVAELGRRIGRPFKRVSVKTFHSLGFGAVLRKIGKGYGECEPDDRKLRKLFFAKFGPEADALYGSFVADLVSLGKGQGIGTHLCEDTPAAWEALVDHHALFLDSEEADEWTAIKFAHRLLMLSNEAALRGELDFDDMIYLPVLWRLSIWKNDWVFVDEAQDTNPCRRELARMTLQPWGRLVAVGDDAQAIFGFTGASHDALDQIREDFGARELPLTVSYRCPKIAETLVRAIPMIDNGFTVWEGAPAGVVEHLSEKEALAKLGPRDAVLCRNTAPLVNLAFRLISAGRGCVILGRDIGKSLRELVEKQSVATIKGLEGKLEAYRAREVKHLTKKGKEGRLVSWEKKIAAVHDRVDSLMSICRGLPEGERTVQGLLLRLDTMFRDDGRGVLTLCTMHKAKGLEWPRVAILQPELIPSPFARREHQLRQEYNLRYVGETRFQQELYFIKAEEQGNG